MIAYTCPSCKSKLENIDSQAGKRDKCPDCGLEHTVPHGKKSVPAPRPFTPAEPMVSISDIAEALETQTIPPVKTEPVKPKAFLGISLRRLPNENTNKESATFAESILCIDGYFCLIASLLVFLIGTIIAASTHGRDLFWTVLSASIGLFSAGIISFWMQDLLQYLRKLIFEIRELRSVQNNDDTTGA